MNAREPQQFRVTMNTPRTLTINGGPPKANGLAAFEKAIGRQIPDGNYWYDAKCGVWGNWGGPGLGFLPPGLDLAGPLPQDASGGATPVIVNGRALHPMDVAALNQLLILVGAQCMPGRWQLDSAGNLGPEGGVPLLNLMQLAAAAGGGGGGGAGGDNFWSTRYGAAGNSSGGAGYISLPGGGSVTWGM